MKKLLFLISMLCSMTAAWAGTGIGTKEYPYTGTWNDSDLLPQLTEGKHLAYDCIITNFKSSGISVFDDKVNAEETTQIIGNWEKWAVGYAISATNPLATIYQAYYSLNSTEDRNKHTFVVTKVIYREGNISYITGHYSGHYDRGDGTKENPFCGEWEASELGPKLKKGSHLAYDCVIKYGEITVKDSRLGQEVATNWPIWAPGNLIADPQQDSPYKQYGDDNKPNYRKSQTFILTDVSPRAEYSSTFTITGYFSGFYRTPDADGFYTVYTAGQLKTVINGSDHAKVRLTGDIYMSDLGEGESGRHALCSTFYGILDGDGHTVWAAAPTVQHNSTGHYHRQYLFTYSNGATFKNLTFKNFRVQSEDNHNQAVLTSEAMNGCVFENITFDHVSLWCKKDNAGAATGFVKENSNCVFKDITVRNSDITVDGVHSGAVIGHAMNCNFENIKVEHCESTSRSDMAGGVAGRADKCTFGDVEILGSFIKTERCYAGGVAGHSANSKFTNCTTDDQSCVCAQGHDGNIFNWEFNREGFAGGIVAHSTGDDFHNCINSALIASYNPYTGGIVGYAESCNVIENCLNTGMIIVKSLDDVKNSLYNNYKTKTGMTCVTKTYQGKEYVIRKYDGGCNSSVVFGGIVGELNVGTVSKCTNLGSVCADPLTGYHGQHRNSFGGIAGYSKGTIINCLSDFSSNSEVKGISGMVVAGSTIKRNLNVTTYNDFVTPDNTINGVTGEGSYTLATNSGEAYAEITGFIYYPTKLQAGEICHELGANWEQNIGTDPYPMPTGSNGLYHTRNISNQYGTVCLPFPVKSDDKISYYIFNDVIENGQDVKLVFKYEEELINEGTPLLFCSAEAKDANADSPVNVCFNNAGNDYTNHPGEYPAIDYWSSWGILGTLRLEQVFDATTDPSTDYIYYLSNGEIRNAKKVTIPPYRAWIEGPSIDKLTAAGKRVVFSVEDEDGTTTDLKLIGEDLVPVKKNGKVYTIMGTVAPSWYKGIVIKNGKKVIQ